MAEYTRIFQKYFDTSTPINGTKSDVTIGSGENGSVGIEYDLVGAQGNDYTIEVVEGTGVNTALSATLTDKAMVVTLGTTPATKASINIGSGTNGVVTVTADVVGADGNDFTITVSDAGAEGCAMTAALVGTDITVELGKTLAILEPTKNTAILVAAAITALAGVVATHSGTGATALPAAIAQTNFSGGSDGGTISTPKNTATLIAGVINLIDGFTATASGTGADAITSAEASADFEGGQYATEAKQPSLIIIDDVWYFCDKPVDKYSVDGWYSGTPALVTA